MKVSTRKKVGLLEKRVGFGIVVEVPQGIFWGVFSWPLG